MKLYIDRYNGESIEGKFFKKDSSYLFVKKYDDNIIMVHWENINSLYKINKKNYKEIKIDSFRKGRDQV